MARKIAYLSVFIALAIIVGYIEQLIPVPIGIPGIKLGISNTIILIALYYFDAKTAFSINIIRIILSGLLFAGFSGMLYSLSGGLLSFLFMYLAKRVHFFSIIGVSVVGGIFHNIGQILMAALIVSNLKLFSYLPVLLISGLVTGVLVGLTAKYVLVYLNHYKKNTV